MMGDEYNPFDVAGPDGGRYERETKTGHSVGTGTVANQQLLAFIERIERLEEEKKTIADDIKDVYGEAKATGFDTKALRAIIRIRKKDAQEYAEEQSILETYLHALGMLRDDGGRE